MASFHCISCNYGFEGREGKLPKKCPYCGKFGSVRRERTAEELVSEVNTLMRDIEEGKSS